VKPIGIDWVALSIDSTAAHQMVARGHYGDSVENQMRAPVGEWRGSTDLSYRFSIFDAIPQPDRSIRTGIDNANVLQELSFYARNPTTGVVSEFFDTKIKVVRRKANITMSFEPRRLPR
jgi:hypothetical protein